MNETQPDGRLGPVLSRPASVTHVCVAASTDPGRRTRNEDALVALDVTCQKALGGDAPESIAMGPRGVLLAVADGMGGHANGDVASTMVIDSLTRAMTAATRVPAGPAYLHEAVQLAQHRVWSAAQDASGRARMGTTLTAVHVRGRAADVAQVGDSRAYVLRAGVLHSLTRDQSYTQMLIDEGILEAHEVALSPHPHLIMQAIGHDREVRVALGSLELRDRDCLLLCSDGLTNAVPDAEIASVILRARALQDACSELVALANARDGSDNVTVVLCEVAGNLPPCDTHEPFGETHHVFQEFAPPPILA